MPDTVLARVTRPGLSVVLTAFHRGGYGHLLRVLDPERAPLVSQLERAGISDARMAVVGSNEVVVFIPAPQRTDQAAAIAVANGASDIEIVTRGTATSETVAPRLISHAVDRRDRRTSRRAVAEAGDIGQANTVAD